MEAFESFVAVALETEGFVVSEAIKFPVKRKTGKSAYSEEQTHGYEVDLVAARRDRLVLATVKSFFGSQGVVADHVMGLVTKDNGRRLYVLLHDATIRDGVIQAAADRYGYGVKQIDYGCTSASSPPPRKAPTSSASEPGRRRHTSATARAVHGLDDVVTRVRAAAARSQYRDNPVLVTIKVLDSAGLLTLRLPDDIG